MHVFRFPKCEDLRNRWIAAIPRKGFVPTEHSRICHKHFQTESILWTAEHFDEKTGRILTVNLERPRIKEGCVPSIFPGCPSYLSSQLAFRESPDEKRMRVEAAQLQKALNESVTSAEQYDSENKISCILDLTGGRKINFSSFWTMIGKADSVIFVNIETPGSVPQLHYSVVVNEQLQVSVFYKGVLISNIQNKYKFPCKINYFHEIESILECVETCEAVDTKDKHHLLEIMQNILDKLIEGSDDKAFFQFVKSQIHLVSSRDRLRYKPEDLLFFSLVQIISPAAYRFMRESGNLLMPHQSTIRRLCSSLNVGPELEKLDSNFLCYIKNKVPLLQSQDMIVTLMVDEIYIKQYLDYKGGNVVGNAFDSQELASSAHTFMISSIMSSYKDVVHILPVRTVTAELLHRVLKKVVLGLEEVGFKVLAVVSDNNSVNRKAMTFFSNKPKMSIVYPHPADSSRPLFFVIDPVHLLKCIRNNWLNQKTDACSFRFPPFDGSSNSLLEASFSEVRKLYNLESDKLLKYGYGLSLKALYPSSLEKQNVKLVIQIFNDYIVEALKTLGPSNNLSKHVGTAEFIRIISLWWKILNVKAPYKGLLKRDKMQEPLTNSNTDEQFIFLNNFLIWLDKWEELANGVGILSKETLSALKLSTHSIIEITNYCVDELALKYILPGKFQTDLLEDRFGKYRQLAGAQYHVSIRQIFEVEKKLRFSTILRISLRSETKGEIKVNYFDVLEPWKQYSSENTPFSNNFASLSVTESDITDVGSYLPVITYLGGYCAYSVIKKLKCDICKDCLVFQKIMHYEESFKLIRNLDRGGLLYPRPFVVNAVMYSYITISKLIGPEYEKLFLQEQNQRQQATSLILHNLSSNFEQLDLCGTHTSENILKMIIWVATNSLLKNYCNQKLNTQGITSKGGKKRKLETILNK